MQELKKARLHSQAFPEKDIYQMYFLKTYCNVSSMNYNYL